MSLPGKLIKVPGKLLSKAKTGALHAGVRLVVGRWWRDGQAGEYGVEVMQFLKKLQGVRSAVMALVLLVEVVSKALGFDGGPVFTMVRTLFAAVGWDPAQANTLFDPAVVGSAIVTIYVAVKRVLAWSKSLRAAPQPTASN